MSSKFIIAGLFMVIINISLATEKLCNNTKLKYYTTPTCKELVKEILKCDKNSTLGQKKPYEISKLIKAYNRYEYNNDMHKNELLENKKVQKCVEDKSHDKIYDTIHLKDAKEKFNKIKNVKVSERIHYLGIILNWFSPINYTSYKKSISLIVEDEKYPFFFNTNGEKYKKCEKITKLKQMKGNREEPISLKYQEILPYLSARFLKRFKISKGTTVSMKASGLFKLCGALAHNRNLYMDNNIQTKQNLIKYIDFFSRYSRFGIFRKKIKYNDLLKIENEIPLIGTSIKRAKEDCISDKIYDHRKVIYSKIKKTKEWKKSLKYIESTFFNYQEDLKELSQKKWGFRLALNKGSSVNKVLGFVRRNPLSKESSKTFLKDIKKSVFNVGELRFNSVIKNIEVPDLASYNAFVDSSDKALYFYPASVLFSMNKEEGKLVTEFAIAHELAHIYTLGIELGSFSEGTLTDIVKNFNSCLYEDKKKKVLYEDLADLLAVKLFTDRNQSLTYMDISNLMTGSFCSLSQSVTDGESREGHSNGFDRAYNFVKYSDIAQEALSCHIPESVCSISFK